MQHEHLIDVDQLSNFIREIDGQNDLGAGALAEKISHYVESLGAVKELRNLAAQVSAKDCESAGRALREKYESQTEGLAGHPDYPVSDWNSETNDGNTRLSYWSWVAAQIEYEDEE